MLQLPRTWNEQFLLLLGLLYAQCIFVFFFVHLASPVFDTPAGDRYALHNQIEKDSRRLAEEPLSFLESIRWEGEALSDWLTSWTVDSSSTHPLKPPLLPRPGDAPLLHPHSRRSQISSFHVHSQSPYMFNYLEHIARAYETREKLQRHMLQHTIREGVWNRFAKKSQSQLQPPQPGQETEPRQQQTKDTQVQPVIGPKQADSSPVQATSEQPQKTAPAQAAAGPSTPGSESAAALQIISDWHLRGAEARCNDAIGSGMLRKWDGTRTVFCEAPQLANSRIAEATDSTLHDIITRISSGGEASESDYSLPPARLVCRSMTIPFMPPPTAPHSFCSANNVLIDFARFSPADAPKYRPNYVMGKGNHYHFVAGQTFTANCVLAAGYRVQTISADHQRDIVDGFGPVGETETALWRGFVSRMKEKTSVAPPGGWLTPNTEAFAAAVGSGSGLVVIPHTLLLITRENGEHCNFYHTMTDLFNAYLMVSNFRLERAQTQILFLDNHGPSPFDVAWQRVFSGAGEVLRANHLLDGKKQSFKNGRILAASVVMSPPGYSSPLYRHLYEDDGECMRKADLFPAFAQFFLEGFGVSFRRWTGSSTLENMAAITKEEESKAVRETIIAPLVKEGMSNPATTILHVILVSRRPYDHFVEHKKISRQIFNEPVLFDFLKQAPGRYPDIHVDIIDFARIQFEQQIKLMASTDLLIGMHGAALSHAMFLPPWGGLLELHPNQQRWQCFRHQTEWSGHAYFSWRNPRFEKEREDATGSGLDVDVTQFQAVFDQALEAVRLQRKLIEQEIAKI